MSEQQWVMGSKRSRERALREELAGAIPRGEIVPYYQPIVDMRSRRVVRFEALARWPRAGNTISPTEFIPLAERSGLISPLRRLMIVHALAQARIWRERIPDLRVGVNLSALSLGLPHLPEEIMRAVVLAGADPTWLALEITEGALAQDPDGVAEHVRRLRGAGIRIDIDDFGIGYSSLRHLRIMPVDSVKIDQEFVARAANEPISQSIVRMIVGLCHELGISAVAEGVETPEAWAHLAEAGCDEAQGYYVGRPLPADEVLGWIDAWRERAEENGTLAGCP